MHLSVMAEMRWFWYMMELDSEEVSGLKLATDDLMFNSLFLVLWLVAYLSLVIKIRPLIGWFWMTRSSELY